MAMCSVAAFSPAGDRLVTGGSFDNYYSSNTVYLWDVDTGKRLLACAGHESSIKALSFSADGKRLASCGLDGAIIWDVAGRQPLRRFVVPGISLELVALSAEGNLLATGGDIRERGQVRLWNAGTGKELTGLTWEVKDRSMKSDGGLRFSPDGRSLLVTESSPPQFQLYSMSEKRLPRLTSLEGLPPHCSATFTPDGREIMAPSGAGIVRWDTASGQERLRLGKQLDLSDIYGCWTDTAALSPDGRTLALGARNGVFGLWETATGKEMGRLTARNEDRAITATAFSPDSRFVLAGARDGSLRCWDVLTGEELASRAAHAGTVHALAFTSDGRTLASASADTTVLLWDFAALLKRRPQTITPNAQSLEELWDHLAKNEDRPHRAIAVLADAGVVSFLAEKLRPLRVEQVERKTIAELLSRLDDAKFNERRKATEALKQFGIRAEADLRIALLQASSLEMRRRIEDILAALPRDTNSVASGERLRALRCLAALEFAGTAAARQVLESMAQEAADGVVRSEAATALVRLQHAGSRP
jgi:WD40 repeat protein